MSAAPLLHVYRPVLKPRLRLFCFPFAGGNGTLFYRWPEYLPDDIEVVTATYPGRMHRLGESPFIRMTALVPHLAEEIRQLPDCPFALLGHSLGALVAFELAHWFHQDDGRSADQVFVLGRRAPQIPETEDDIHQLSKTAFLQKVQERYSNMDAVLADAELQDLVLPALRSDMEILETWRYVDRGPLSIPLTVIGGASDARVSRAMLDGWLEQTSVESEVKVLVGDHFFIQGGEEMVVPLIAEKLAAPRDIPSVVKV